MPDKLHQYSITLTWTGDTGAGTAAYAGYSRAHEISAAGKPPIPGSSDPAFRGDAARWNPEELFLAAIASCHQLWYLHLCATAGVVVTAYSDQPAGTMAEQPDGAGQFTAVVLHPAVTIAPGSDAALALKLHDDAAAACFLARSVNFPVTHEPAIQIAA